MDDQGQILPTKYMSSRGETDIATMPYPYLLNVIAKMERESRSSEPVFAALVARKAIMDAEQAEKEAAAPVADAVAGHNGAPEASPFEAVKAELEDLRIEAGNFLDGAEIKSQAEADQLGRLLEKVRAAAKRADDSRVSEKKPFDDGANEVQERYNALIGRTKKLVGLAPRMEDVIKQAMTTWLRKLAAEQEAVRVEAARRAEEARQAAEISIASTHQTPDMDERDAALAEVDIARQAAIDLAAANRMKPQAQGDTRAIGLRTVYRPEIVKLSDALKHYWMDRPEAFTDLVIQFAKDDIRSGKRELPGINVISEQVV